MKKYLYGLVTLLTLVSFVYCIPILKVNEITYVLAENKNLSFSSLSVYEIISQYDRIIELILLPNIIDSVNRIYGENQRGIDEYEILEIERGYYPSPFDYRITIKFRTYTQAHSSPFDENIAVYDITDFNPLTIKEVSFEHHPLEVCD